MCLSPSWRVFCKSVGEDIDQLFLHCPCSSFISHKIFYVFQVQGAVPKGWKEFTKLNVPSQQQVKAKGALEMHF